MSEGVARYNRLFLHAQVAVTSQSICHFFSIDVHSFCFPIFLATEMAAFSFSIRFFLAAATICACVILVGADRDIAAGEAVVDAVCKVEKEVIDCCCYRCCT